ncbi:MAG: SEC-C metal-binding domain-containing protein [Parachlamydiaceae bacterium]
MVEKVGRNDLCSCGSGKKYKNCCFHKDHQKKTPLGGRKFTAKLLSGKSQAQFQEEGSSQVKPMVDYNTLMERSFGAALHSHENQPPAPKNPSEYLVVNQDDPS